MKYIPVIKKTGCFIATAMAACTAFGQQDTARLQEMSLKDLLNVKVTTASKSLQDIGIAPATITVITKEQIRMRGYQSLLDLIYDLPDVKVDDKIYSGIRNSFTVRGIQGSEKFIILLDGVAISSPSGEAMPIMENYPVNLAEQVEIVYGPASALYGANAVSIIINVITQKQPQKEWRVDAGTTAGSYGYTNTSLLISKKITPRTYLIVSGQYSYDKQPDYSKLYSNDSAFSLTPYKNGTFNTIYGPMTPATPFKPTYEAPMQAYNIYAALHMDDFTFSFFRNYTKIPTALGNNTNNAIYNKDVYMAQSVTTLNASYKKVAGRVTSASSITSSEYNLDPESNYRNLYSGMEPVYKYSTCFMVKAEEQVDYKPSGKLNITAGAGYESYFSIPQSADLAAPVNKKSFVSGSYAGTVNHYDPDGLEAQFYMLRYYNISSYLQAQYSPISQLHISAGVRYDNNSRYGITINPRAGIVYRPFSRTTIKLLYGAAYLAPSPSDSYSQYGAFDTPDSGRTYHSYFLHLPNPGLEPIKSHTTELSFQQYLSDNINISLNGYYNALSGLHAFANDNTSTHLYNNMFYDVPVDYVEVFINQGKQSTYGGSFQINWKQSIGIVRMNSYAALSYVNGHIKGNNPANKEMELDFISPVMVHAGSDIKAGKFTCSPRLILTSKQNISGFADTTGSYIKRQTIAGYALVNVSLRYAASKKVSLYVNVLNALNQRYKSTGFNMDLNNQSSELFYGQPEDPLRVMTGINVSF